MSKDNLKLWESVEETNPNYTKNANVSGNKITSIAPQYQIKNVTEKFGIYGKAWGFKDIELDYSLVSVPYMKDKTEGVYPNKKVVGVEDAFMGLVVFKATFFFPNGEFPVINSISLFTNNDRTKLDDNFAKKIETDTLTKAISKLGFNADIFMGRFDNLEYVAQLKEKYSDSALLLQELIELREEVEEKIPEEDLEHVDATIDNENIAKYAKLKIYLTKLKTS